MIEQPKNQFCHGDRVVLRPPAGGFGRLNQGTKILLKEGNVYTVKSVQGNYVKLLGYDDVDGIVFTYFERATEQDNGILPIG